MTATFEPLWDVLEEHLDEAEYLWGAWEHALVAPDYTLEEVEATVESRLLAHLDGLVVGADAARERLVVPALESDEFGRAAAAATALLLDPEAAPGPLFTVLRDLPEQRPALVRALACSDRADLVPALRELLADVDEAVVGAAAEALLFHHEPLGDALSILLASDDPALRSLGLRALPGEPPAPAHARAVQAALGDSDLLVVDAAIDAGVLLAPSAAWARVRDRAGEPDPSAALLLLALRGGPDDLARVVAALADEPRRLAAIHALSHVGAPELVDVCLEWLEDAAAGPLVGEMLAALTGVDLDEAELALPGGDDDALAHAPEDDLPRPEPMATMQWWLRQRPRFAEGQRWLGGRLRTPAVVVDALGGGPMRRRPALLLDLQLHAARGVRPRLQPRAPTSRQRRELAELARLLGSDST